MKRTKLINYLGLVGLFVLGVIIVVNVAISHEKNYLSAYEFWIGVCMIIISIIFLRSTQTKKRIKKK